MDGTSPSDGLPAKRGLERLDPYRRGALGLRFLFGVTLCSLLAIVFVLSSILIGHVLSIFHKS